MNDIVIKKHNFDLAKNRLKEFSEKTESELRIDKVRTSGGFLGWGSHKVTGSEFNSRLETIQSHFMAVNATNNRVIREFKEIYNALDALDNDYIKSIVASVKALEKTSNDVRMQQTVLTQHNDKLQEQQRELDLHQIEIDKIVENIKKTVNVLKAFKEKLDGLKHLTDIDKIWLDYKSIHDRICVLSDSLSRTTKVANANNQENINRIKMLKNTLKNTEKQISNLYEQCFFLKEKLDSIEVFTTTLENIVHIKDIDEMWESLSSAHNFIHNISNELDSIKKLINKDQENINSLLLFMKKMLTLNHLMEIDDIWNSVEKHTLQIIENEKKDEELATIIQNNKKEVENKIENVVQATNADIECLTKRVKYAYLIAGASMGLAIIELILLFVKVV